jgi:predicted NBD/HSP70 family sugar kinase
MATFIKLMYNNGMILGIDVGGTKTLLGMFDAEGVLTDSVKFPTPSEYDDFLSELHTNLASFVKQQKVDSCTIAAQ